MIFGAATVESDGASPLLLTKRHCHIKQFPPCHYRASASSANILHTNRAVTMTTTTLTTTLQDIISPKFHQNNFLEEQHVKNDLGIKLDKGMYGPTNVTTKLMLKHPSDDQICRLALSATGCPLGPLHCPLRHTAPSAQNFQPPKQLPTHPRERERLATVCKHWLRGLCKKGDACEFLHEYNLRRMPECWWFAKYNYCSAGDECLYAHPKERKVECPDYKRGFCKLGMFLLLSPPCISSSAPRILRDDTHLRSCYARFRMQAPLVPANMSGESHVNCTSQDSVLWVLIAPVASAFPSNSIIRVQTDMALPSPKPGIPPPKAYEQPDPPSVRDLGPPPPGYGRYADFDRGNGGNFPGPHPPGLGGSGGPPGPRRNLEDVVCYKVCLG